MGRERVIYPNNPEKWVWEGYKKNYPFALGTLDAERTAVKDSIDELKLKLFALVGATPKDITNDNNDPVEYVTSMFNQIMDDYFFNVKKEWYLWIVDEYETCIKEGAEDNLEGTIDENTERPWKPYIDIVGMYADGEYTCEHELKDNAKVAEMLKQELMMYVMGTPSDMFKDDDENSTDSVFFRVREILNSEDGIEYYWWRMFEWKFAADNFNEESYNSY